VGTLSSKKQIKTSKSKHKLSPKSPKSNSIKNPNIKRKFQKKMQKNFSLKRKKTLEKDIDKFQ
jgi:hypothetical protein